MLAPLLIAFELLGVNRLCRHINRNKGIVLWYHGIRDDNASFSDFPRRKLNIPASVFRKQLAYLKNKGYSFVSLSELANIPRNSNKVVRPVTLTFDDGYENVIRNAYPIMKEYGAMGCLYLVSNTIDTNQLLWPDHVWTVIGNSRGEHVFTHRGVPIKYRLGSKKSYRRTAIDVLRRLRALPYWERMEHLRQFDACSSLDKVPREFRLVTAQQVKSLDKDVLEVGCHTRTHAECADLVSDCEFQDEMENSKSEIEHIVGYKVKHFCYPAGLYNARAMEHVKRYGYQTAVTTEPGFTDETADFFRLRRIPAEEDLLLFKALTSGSALFLLKLKFAIKGKWQLGRAS